MERQLADQMPGGSLWDPSPQLAQEAESCNSSNISGERIFGRVDALCKKAPNMRPEKLESKVLYLVNKTSTWLGNQTAAERDRRVECASKDAVHIAADEKQRGVRHVVRLQEKVRMQREQKVAKEKKKPENVEQNLEDVMEMGL